MPSLDRDADTTVRPCRKATDYVQQIDSTISSCTCCQKKPGCRAAAWRLMHSISNIEASNAFYESTHVARLILVLTLGYTSITCLSLYPLYSPLGLRRTERAIEQAINNIDVKMVHTP